MLLSVLFMYIIIEGLSVTVSCVVRYTQNNLEYLIQNMIHQVIQTHHSMSELIF